MADHLQKISIREFTLYYLWSEACGVGQTLATVHARGKGEEYRINEVVVVIFSTYLRRRRLQELPLPATAAASAVAAVPTGLVLPPNGPSLADITAPALRPFDPLRGPHRDNTCYPPQMAMPSSSSSIC